MTPKDRDGLVERLHQEADASEELNPGDSDIATMREAAGRITELEAERDRLAAQVGEKDKALRWAEAVMSMVEPRSDKAEYLECLTAVRQALTSASAPTHWMPLPPPPEGPPDD